MTVRSKQLQRETKQAVMSAQAPHDLKQRYLELQTLRGQVQIAESRKEDSDSRARVKQSDGR